MITDTPLGFADQYADFRNELQGLHRNPDHLSQRGLTTALLTVFRELLRDPDPVPAITAAISAYRDQERTEAEEHRAHQAAEERQYTEWIAAETRARTAECPSCHARPGDVCHRPNGRPAPESHRYRYRAARQLGDGQADATILEPPA